LWEPRRIPSPGGIRRWKAPRVQRNAISFAGGRVRRPYPASPRQWAGGGDGAQASLARRARTGSTMVDPVAPASPAGDCREPATRGVRADRVGAKLSPRAIAVEGAAHRGLASSSRPLARDFSAGFGAARSGGHPQLGDAARRPSRAKLHQRATAGAVLRSSDGRGRARGSQRLQKSTGGARPFSPTSEEHVDHDEGSSFSARERRKK